MMIKKKVHWITVVAAFAFTICLFCAGVLCNRLSAVADQGDDSATSTVGNTVLQTPEMTKGYLQIKSAVSDYAPEKTWDRWDGYILTMKLAQSDLSLFTNFWWNIEAKGGAYASSTKDYTECFVGFQSEKGRNFIWGSPAWGDNGSDIVHYSPTFLGVESGQVAVNRRVQFAAKGNAWYTIPATKVAISNDENATSWENSTVAGESNALYNDVAYATVWMPSRTFDADIAIGALYGVKEDGSYSLLFDPSQSEQVDNKNLLNSANKFCTEATVGDGAVSWTITKIEPTNLMPLHDGIGKNNYFSLPIANVLPEDISAYNGISYYIDNSANELPTDIQLVITDKGADGAATQEELWYSDNQGFSFFYENSETATGNYVVLNNGNQIPAGKKGTVVIPFSSFYQPWESNNKLFDLDHVKGNLTLVYHPQDEAYAANYSVGKFTLVTDAKAEFKEYRLYQKADGSYPEITVNGMNVSYSDMANVKEIERVETDGIDVANMTGKTSGIENEKLYQYSKTEVETGFTPVNGGGNANGRVVPVTYYERKTVTVTFMSGSEQHAQKDVIWGGKVEMPDAPVSDGVKVFADWYFGTEQGGVVEYADLFAGTVGTENITVYAKYGYRYFVKYHLQNLAGDGYEEQTADTQTKAGEEGATTVAEAKTYTGFTAQTFAQGIVTVDGNTVVNVYYTRNSYTVTFDVNGTKTEQIVKYGGKIEKPEDPNVEGYTFGGWKLNGALFDFDTYTMGTSDITLTAALEEVPAKQSGCNGCNSSIGTFGTIGCGLALIAFGCVGCAIAKASKKRKKQ